MQKCAQDSQRQNFLLSLFFISSFSTRENMSRAIRAAANRIHLAKQVSPTAAAAAEVKQFFSPLFHLELAFLHRAGLVRDGNLAI